MSSNPDTATWSKVSGNPERYCLGPIMLSCLISHHYFLSDILSKPEEHLEPHSESSAEPSEESDSVISPG